MYVLPGIDLTVKKYRQLRGADLLLSTGQKLQSLAESYDVAKTVAASANCSSGFNPAGERPQPQGRLAVNEAVGTGHERREHEGYALHYDDGAGVRTANANGRAHFSLLTCSARQPKMHNP
jgi:hypothetical protein